MLALDPDIPDARERLLLEAAPAATRRSRSASTGSPSASAGEPRLWQPARGRHALALVGPEGRVVDTVRFEVR